MGLRWCSGHTTRLSPLRFQVQSPVRWTRTQSSCEKSIVNAFIFYNFSDPDVPSEMQEEKGIQFQYFVYEKKNQVCEE